MGMEVRTLTPLALTPFMVNDRYTKLLPKYGEIRIGEGKQVSIMKGKRFIPTVILLTVGMILIISGLCWAAPKRVLVLPFKMNAAQDTSYLQQGILDMLSSRLEWANRVVVMPKAEARAAFDKFKGNIDKTSALELGRSVGADYVLFGSVTMLGENVSLDANMLDLASLSTPVTVFSQTEGLDGVIPKINEFAQNINAKVFGRGTAAASGDSPRPQTQPVSPLPGHRRHPDYLLTGQEGRSTSPLNPNFIAAVGAKDQEGSFWRSPSIPQAIVGMDIGDVDADGKNEVVYASATTVYVNRVENGRFQRVALHKVQAGYRLLSVDVEDVDGDGRAEIFVSSQQRFNARSFVFEVRNGKIFTKVKDSPWYYRVVYLTEGRRLVGQRSGTGEAFYRGPQIMKAAGGGYVPDKPLKLPKGYNLFGVAVAMLSEGGKEHLVAVSEGEHLMLLSRGGQEIWKSKDYFAGTMNYIEYPWGLDRDQDVLEDDRPRRIWLPSRLIITDLDDDGQKEIIVAKNEFAGTRLMSRLRFFDQGAIYSLRFSQLAIRENWRSRNLPGPLSDYQIKDYDNDGRPDLVTAVVIKQGDGMMDGRSAIVAYQLAGPEEMRRTKEQQKSDEGIE